MIQPAVLHDGRQVALQLAGCHHHGVSPREEHVRDAGVGGQVVTQEVSVRRLWDKAIHQLEMLSPSTRYPLLQQSKGRGGGKLEWNICDFK